MGCLKKTLSFLLIFVSIYARGTPLQETDPVRQRKPFFERLRRLEEQFQRLQQVTLTHLQDIANNYNVYYNVDARFQSLVEESQAIALAVNQSQAAIQEDVAHLKTWFRKNQRRSKKLAQRGPGSLQLRRSSQTSRASLHRGSPPQDFTVRVQKTQKFRAPSSHQAAPPRTQQGPGNICSMGPVLIFPNASTENVIFLSPGFLVPLRALSFCSWVRMASGHLGTLLSYATKDNDNKLVLHGRDSLVPGTIHFVIGDPIFRELSLRPLLDGQWHHICIIWTSMEGKYWLHIDRRIVATGSRFREGYEIPPGGSLVLGQEQDTMGGQFDSSEAFVGSISGLAIWDRALIPREVANLATGKELPTGAILTLTNATSVGGFVQRANCTCLEQCP
uniref:pentraxin-4 isoform X2 n=1 Tax=Myodes glareolus TaxID=447135 RepID=UPI002020C4A5|nr:pentraxin-4 isoform X2 [Myodes glareolus]